MKQVTLTEDDWGSVVASLVIVTRVIPDEKDLLDSIREDIMLQVGFDAAMLAREFKL